MSLCPDALADWPPERLRSFRARAARQRVPLAGTLELTRNCNLRCVHCYLEPADRAGENVGAEMSTAEVCALIDHFVAAGCISLVITGGDPMLRPDFADVYRRAREAGLLVQVFTNATNVTPEIVELFRELPPTLVDISLYGATAPVYEAVTRVRGSFERCLDGIRNLQEAGVHVALKTMILRANAEGVPAIRGMAKALGTSFRADAAVCVRLEGGREPLGQRVAPQLAARLELADPARHPILRAELDRVRALPKPDRLYDCGAATTGFFLAAGGTLHPCVLSPAIGADALQVGFRGAWDAIGEEIRALPADPGSPCLACDLRGLCGTCPAVANLERGRATEPVPYLCELGGSRLEILESTRSAAGATHAA